MKEIGGYLDFSAFGRDFHQEAGNYYVNSCRNALVFFCQQRNIKQVHLPFYTCGVLRDSLTVVGIQIAHYRITKSLKIANFPNIEPSREIVVYTNYFGLMDAYIQELREQQLPVIIDNAQAFYANTIGIPSMYSPRKFFPLPDGGILKTSLPLDASHLEQATSHDKISHLTKRVDEGAQLAYQDFQKNDQQLESEGVKGMSNLTLAMLSLIDHEQVKSSRTENFQYLDDHLKEQNLFTFHHMKKSVPMAYPYLVENGKELKQHLIRNKIYVPTYWPDVYELVDNSMLEHKLLENLVAIPIDQRYDQEDMQYIVESIHQFI